MNKHQAQAILSPAVQGVIRPVPVDDPAMRLFLFHHAGGSHIVYRDWVKHFPADWEICLLEAPGRGRLHRLPLLPTVGELARSYLRDGADVKPLLDRPFAVFGHSLGAMAAYEFTRLLRAEGLPQPLWLGVSAVRPPHVGPSAVTHRSHLPAPELKAALLEMGGTSREVLDEPQLWELFEPLLRNDFRAAEEWKTELGLPRLDVPLSVFGGDADPAVRTEMLDGWERWTDHWLGRTLFPGRHFYFQDDPRPLIERIVTDIRRVGS
ncbi:thioesterase II family protein [Kitasatospora kifunensis]|uniref:Surfactin synthase thioesterase subunit n=1 Tax=Kitasatospora kifunensis TaxID=58351 RepID=A0A7W7VZK5_KITKI|nr:alpha/beta fold hydrolase [Kitasatospora kifunensis]MBB4928198.1 surfactin synthase thioesterase subunit [Kitasatospora kifunensis]